MCLYTCMYTAFKKIFHLLGGVCSLEGFAWHVIVREKRSGRARRGVLIHWGVYGNWKFRLHRGRHSGLRRVALSRRFPRATLNPASQLHARPNVIMSRTRQSVPVDPVARNRRRRRRRRWTPSFRICFRFIRPVEESPRGRRGRGPWFDHALGYTLKYGGQSSVLQCLTSAHFPWLQLRKRNSN